MTPIPTKEEIKKYHDERFKLIPKDLLEECAKFINELLDDKSKETIREDYKIHGNNWIHARGQHFGWGMWLRNQLRKAGFTDDKLPGAPGGWDSYYTQVVEYALGLRK